MEPITTAAILAAIAGGAISPFALIWWASRSTAAHAWQSLVEELGLELHQDTLLGQLHGQRVEAALRRSQQGEVATITARLALPLDLGLNVRHKKSPKHLVTPEQWGALLGGHDITTDSFRFDHQFHVTGDDDFRVRALLTPALRERMLQHLPGSMPFHLTDQGIVIETLAYHHIPTMRRALHGATLIAAEIEQARPQVRAATELTNHRPVWAAFAAAHHMRLIDTPLCVWGRLSGVEMRIATTRQSLTDRAVDVGVVFPQPLGIGIHLQPVALTGRVRSFFRGKDHRLGDRPFDDAFVLQLSDVATGEALLDEDVRARLLAASSDIGPLTLDDEGMSIRFTYVPHDPERVVRAAEQLAELARTVEMVAAQLRQGAAGPYR